MLTFDADVNPVTAGYVKRGIDTAAQNGDAIVVILLNTPGGLLTSMRTSPRISSTAPCR